jgi:hypothetical protein
MLYSEIIAVCSQIHTKHTNGQNVELFNIKRGGTYTRWFKYDRDKLWLVYTQSVPVTFEPPCSNHWALQG